jgi:hypothetical protein
VLNIEFILQKNSIQLSDLKKEDISGYNFPSKQKFMSGSLKGLILHYSCLHHLKQRNQPFQMGFKLSKKSSVLSCFPVNLNSLS